MHFPRLEEEDTRSRAFGTGTTKSIGHCDNQIPENQRNFPLKSLSPQVRVQHRQQTPRGVATQPAQIELSSRQEPCIRAEAHEQYHRGDLDTLLASSDDDDEAENCNVKPTTMNPMMRPSVAFNWNSSMVTHASIGVAGGSKATVVLEGRPEPSSSSPQLNSLYTSFVMTLTAVSRSQYSSQIVHQNLVGLYISNACSANNHHRKDDDNNLNQLSGT